MTSYFQVYHVPEEEQISAVEGDVMGLHSYSTNWGRVYNELKPASSNGRCINMSIKFTNKHADHNHFIPLKY